ncbi:MULTISPECIES: nuclear transport factor 2 family protein [Mycobacteriaceae]|uniref:Polyketide cyclase n=1 Tax=Mycolicibacterium neoaurum VKM Ac-1815D TaxID=700508 RepID=V5X3U2_MYCNE|nr:MULTISPECIES: nuclear transport factor 2 family protein [Mycobacteriaceae]AHC23115.1 polyketide cyclase [Mycolicibacterium neoaurum VKM Ac-1815D]AMO03876.1 polyketide cyclase [Mycolicibacterium neoaurum]AXK77867.1 nuclear transport factor 2 family protein [Mycolicibacterium neoaurum]KJQ48288.1 polyketide cyclase [Mycolicibacterium neoaurum]KUM06472.1 polyketide cyclase [Mycolicibacterium neoaurum]
MSSPHLERWIEFMTDHDPAVLDEQLADDAVFYSPAVFTPQQGKALTAKYLNAAAELFGDADFRYVEQWESDRSAILAFQATVDGVTVDGIDMIHWNDEGKIASFKVMIRPLKGLQAVIPRMAALLGQAR